MWNFFFLRNDWDSFSVAPPEIAIEEIKKNARGLQQLHIQGGDLDIHIFYSSNQIAHDLFGSRVRVTCLCALYLYVAIIHKWLISICLSIRANICIIYYTMRVFVCVCVWDYQYNVLYEQMQHTKKR